MKTKCMIIAAILGLAGAAFADAVNLSQYKWAVIGDSISDPGHPQPNSAVVKSYHYIARDTGIQVVYTNAVGGTGYKKESPQGAKPFCERIRETPIPSDVDVVTIFGSVNDWTLAQPPVNDQPTYGSPTDRFPDSDTLSAYMNAVIDLVQQQAPKAKLILVGSLYFHGVGYAQHQNANNALRAIAEHRGIEFHDWLTENASDPLDFHHIEDNTTAEGSFARTYTIDWENVASNANSPFGHPNDLYNETWLAPKFQEILVAALGSAPAISLGTPTARPSTNYNGSAVNVTFTGTIPDGAAASAKVTIGGVAYPGTVGEGACFFAVPADVVTAGNTYDGVITLTVDGVNYTKSVTLAQGTLKVEEDAGWICETAADMGDTGTWSGDRFVAQDGKISVSNATFTAAKPSPANAVVTVVSTFDFGGANDDAFDPSALAGVKVVKVQNVSRYAFLAGSGVVTNLDVVANVQSPVTVTTLLDLAAGEVTYTIGGTDFGPFPRANGNAYVSGVKYAGAASVAALDGAYRFEGLDSNLAKVGDTEYATVAAAVADAGNDAVTLLWDASWDPAAAGDYNVATNGHTLAIGGDLGYSVRDNGDGTITVTVTGASPDAPEAISITVVGSTVKVGVKNPSADCWYALKKTTDLSEPFVVDTDTWTKGSDLIAGTGELSIALGAGETQAFYRIVVSTTAP